jgi:hypothetical protein
MAELVMGLGTSHGSQVSLTPDWWGEHGKLDRTRTNYDELVKNARPDIAGQLTEEVWQQKYDTVQSAVAQSSDYLTTVAPDALIVIGDDQAELYSKKNIPAISLFWGAEVIDIPRDMTDVPASRAAAMWAKHATEQETYPVASGLAKHLVEQLIAEGFDVAQMAEQPAGKSIGHAFTFVRLRLMGDRVIPIIPVMLNTYFPPNQPTAARCYALGQALRDAVQSSPEGLRVGVVASGGLSHFVVDEELDRLVLDGIAKKDGDVLGSIPEAKLQSGSSEIKNWIVAAGALTDLTFELLEYVPGYRSPAGTGCGMAFGRWA